MNVIDISTHNGIIDFAKVKAAGIDGVIIRAGFGKTNVDKQFLRNINCAISVGLHIGIYWFMYCSDNEGALQNAIKCVETIKAYKAYIDLGVYSDWEYDSDKQAPGQTVASRTDFVKIFNDKIQMSGYRAGTYTNLDYLRSKFDMKQLDCYPVWIAQYASELSTKYIKGYDCVMWQYSSKGKVNGITGHVDMNEFYGFKGEFTGTTDKNSDNSVNNKQEDKGEYDMPTIKYGSSGKAVMIWQVILGFTGNDVDGIFGSKTKTKTENYQKKCNLTVDGIVGPKTWKKGLESVG